MEGKKMYVCGSCGHMVRRISSTLGNCPQCSRDSLEKKQFKCPQCKKDMGEPIDVDHKTMGWDCKNCKIKVYKELE
jgi:DNA-directed RNA polymerase subunit RPC12/RpoP